MKKFEYRIVDATFTSLPAVAYLNDLGEEGWQPAGTIDAGLFHIGSKAGQHYVRGVFYREKL